MAALDSRLTTYISDIGNVLQKVIAPKIEEVLPEETIFYDMLKTNSGVQKLANNTFYITVRDGRHSGIAAVTEGAKLASGKPKYTQMNVGAKYVFGTFEITDQVLEAAKDSKGALVNYMMEQTRALRIDFARELNRMFWGYGSNIIAKVAAGDATTGTTLTLAPVYSVNSTPDVTPTKYLAAGMKLDINGDACQVASVDSDTVVTLVSGITRVAGENVKKTDGDGSVVDEPMGLDGIISNSTEALVGATFQGLTRASYPFLNAKYVEATSEALGLQKMEKAFTVAREYGKPRFWLMNQSSFNKYGNLLEAYKRTADMKEILSGGWKGLDFMGGQAAVVLDYDCPDGRAFLVDPDSITIGEMTPISWIDRGDGVLRRVDYASWQGVLRWYGNLIAKDVRANAKLTTKTGI
jgi:hypothetical protein